MLVCKEKTHEQSWEAHELTSQRAFAAQDIQNQNLVLDWAKNSTGQNWGAQKLEK